MNRTRPPRRATGMNPGGALRAAWSVGPAAAMVTLGVLPAFLVAALAVFVRAELGFSEAALGLTIACTFGASALMSVPAGHLTQRIGARRATKT